jgi:deazaflavin-dependent oxidoreductase (nitroreductase family)
MQEAKMLRDRMRVFNKHVTNRILRVFTGLSLGPFAIIRHVGRRSGKSYETVIWVWQMREGFVVALTYGEEVDWYRNMKATNGGTVFWHKRLYVVGEPELIDTEKALTAFPALFRLLFRTFGKQEKFVLMKPTGPVTAQVG